MRLSDGNWLNSETLLPRPQLWAWPVVMSTFLTVIAISLVMALSVRRITKPLRELAQASDRLGRGEGVPDLPERGPEEIVRANRAFNAMQARVSRFVADRTRMVAADILIVKADKHNLLNSPSLVKPPMKTSTNG